MYLHLNILKIPALFDIAFRHTIISQKYKRIVKNRFKVKPCIWRSTGGKKDKHLWFSQILTSWATGTAKVKSRKGETWTQRTPYLQWNMEVDCNPCSFILLLRLLRGGDGEAHPAVILMRYKTQDSSPVHGRATYRNKETFKVTLIITFE